MMIIDNHNNNKKDIMEIKNLTIIKIFYIFILH